MSQGFGSMLKRPMTSRNGKEADVSAFSDSVAGRFGPAAPREAGSKEVEIGAPGLDGSRAYADVWNRISTTLVDYIRISTLC